jgi:hypothetical protein
VADPVERLRLGIQPLVRRNLWRVRQPGRRPSLVAGAAVSAARTVRQLSYGGVDGDGVAVEVETPLPAELGDRSMPFFIGGWYLVPMVVRSVEIDVGGVRSPVRATGQPRQDVHLRLYDRYRHVSGREHLSGFWATATLPAALPGECVDIDMVWRVVGGGEVRHRLGTIARPATPDVTPVPWPQVSDAPAVAVAMATYDPDLDLFETQVQSIRDQDFTNWICVISDDASPPVTFDAMMDVLGDDPRFVVARSGNRRGFYRNFERALRLVPTTATHVALCDQDDRWYPDKLCTLVEALDADPEAQLAYADMRIVDGDGAERSATFWTDRDNNWSDPALLFFANTVTGAASLLRSEAVTAALPFPPQIGGQYHDQWLALVAKSLGGLTYVDRPLHDYVQHSSNVIGHFGRAQMRRDQRWRVGGQRHPAGVRTLQRLAHHYFFDVVRLQALAQAIELRLPPIADAETARTVHHMARLETSAAARGWLAARTAASVGRHRRGLGAQGLLLRSLSWSIANRVYARTQPLPIADGRHSQYVLGDVVENTTERRAPVESLLSEKTQPLDFVVDQTQPRRLNLMVPGIDVDHFFGGYIGKMNLAARLAERGHRVRLVCLDRGLDIPADWRERIADYDGLHSGLEDIDIVAAHQPGAPIRFSPDDDVVATTWWTAYHAEAVVQAIGRSGFLYLIQEYEPLTFAHGAYSAAAEQTYRFTHRALFSTEYLQRHFRQGGIGVYQAGASEGDANSAWFNNAITDVGPVDSHGLQRSTRRLLFYARPEPHAARNMYELGLMALQRAIDAGTFGPEWEFHGCGAQTGEQIVLGKGRTLVLHPRSGQSDYAALLRSCDVGLSLMQTPHPSLPPVEMASAGMRVVTNTYGTKTAELLRSISPNLLAVAPTAEAVGYALADAVKSADDLDQRARGAQVAWSRDWATSLPAELIDRLDGFIEDLR